MAKRRVDELMADGVLSVGDGYRAKNSELGPVGIPFARAGNIDGGFRFDNADCLLPDRIVLAGEKVSRSGDVVFTSKGTVGRFAFVEQDTPRFAYSPQLCFWRSLDGSVLDARYLFFWMRSGGFLSQVDAVKGQTDMAEYVSLRDQRRMVVDVPSLDEQHAIARVLGALDDKIELNRRMNETLEAMARALFKSWFVDFDPVRAKQRGDSPAGMDAATAALFPSRLVQTEQGEIPEGWSHCALREVASLVRGRSYTSAQLQPSTTALVTLKSFLRGGGYRPDGLKEYSGVFKPEQVVAPGEIVVAFTDVTQAAEVIGKPALVRPPMKPLTLVASQDVAILRPTNPLLIPYLYYLMMTPQYQDHAYAHTNGSTVLHLHRDGVEGFVGLQPASPVLAAFHDVALPLLQRQTQNERESTTLASLRDTLLPRLLSGELRVPDAERAVAEVA